jgi:capsule synthesis protein PGA_cap
VRTLTSDAGGSSRAALRTGAARPGRLRYRAALAGGGSVSPALRVRLRYVTLRAVGDINLGDGPGAVMAARGPRWPWVAAAPLLRGADASFHRGIERDTHPTALQRSLARVALGAGASAVIAAHPHVLQPVERPSRHRLVAYSLGNFVWSADGGITARTGLLTVRLSPRGVESAALRRTEIVGTRPTPVRR